MKFDSYEEEACESEVDQGMNQDGDTTGAEATKFNTSVASG